MSENLDTALKAPTSVPLQVCLAVGDVGTGPRTEEHCVFLLGLLQGSR